MAHGRFHTDGKVTVPVAKGFSMSLGWRYQYDHWTFQDVVAPWSNINTAQIVLDSTGVSTTAGWSSVVVRPCGPSRKVETGTMD